VNLITNTGLSKLTEDSNTYVKSNGVYSSYLKAVHALNILVNSLKILWLNDIDFCQQLKSINTGDFEYGKPTDGDQIYYKDIEFEILSAATMARNGLMVGLPDHNTGNDIFYKTIEIQCKHPNVF
jgi:hypothetical protein